MSSKKKNSYPEQVFRANDIRGLADSELTDDFSFALGFAFAQRIINNGESHIMVCRDARLSSPRLYQSLLAGLYSQDIKVIDLGVGPTPLLGFGLAKSDTVHSGIMITASHNPANQNGFKMVLSNNIFYGDKLKTLINDMEQSALPKASSYAQDDVNAQSMDLFPEYLSAIKADIGDLSGLKIVIDGANGAAGPLAVTTFKALGADVIEQYCDLDGRFPNRSPDTSNPENLKTLQDRVLSEKAMAGIGFDGDGDRMVAVTADGQLIGADEIMRIFASSALKTRPGANIVYDVKCSTDVEKDIRAMGGQPVMYKSGRSFIQTKMLETDAAFAGEYSAHYFFQDRWFGTDDGIYAACRLLELCKRYNQSLEQICGTLSRFGSGFNSSSGKVASGEIYLSVPEKDKFNIADQLVQRSNNTADFNIDGQTPRIICLDGLRLEYSQGWALVRASNTSAALTLRFEAESEEFMQNLTKKITEVLNSVSPEIDTDGIHHVT